MQKSRKKLWITLTAVLCSVTLICLICGLLFRLKTVSVEYREKQGTEVTQLAEGTLEKVKNSGEFSVGKNLLFMNFDKNIAKIEKENPYVKVEQIVRRFPNEISVYISERVPRFRVREKNSTNWFILDGDFKVLDKVQDGEISVPNKYGTFSLQEKTVELSSSNIQIEAYIGDFVSHSTAETFKQIASGIMAVYDNKEIGKAKSIYIKDDGTFEIVMNSQAVETGDGCKIVLEGTNELRLKAYSGVHLFYKTIQADQLTDLSNKTIIVSKDKNKDGYYQATFKNSD